MTTAAPPRKIAFLDLKALTASIRGEIDDAIARVIGHHGFINGPEVSEFEKAFAAYCGTRFAVGASNGTTSLHAVLTCAGIGPGDEVIVPSHTFIATIESVVHTGARPVMVEADDATMLVDPAAVAAAITPRTRAIIPVHLYGTPVDMDTLRNVAGDIPIYEDAAQAHGAEWKGVRAGNLATAGSFSFFPGKNLGAFGDAGGVTTSDEALAKKVHRYMNHGRDDKFFHEVIGTNYRLDTLQAAILSVKLRHLDTWNAQRRSIAARYIEILSTEPFKSAGVRWQSIPQGARSSYHLFVFRIPGGRRDAVRDALTQRGVGTGIHYPVPCHLQPALAHLGMKKGSLPTTERICDEIISMPMCPMMKVDDVAQVCEVLKVVL